MTDVETLTQRVRTVERAVTDGDHDFPEVDELAELTDRLDSIEDRLDDIEERTGELEAATQALRGYVGNVRSVNERVEQRADTALAATERLERRIEADESRASPSHRESPDNRTSGAVQSDGDPLLEQHSETRTRAESAERRPQSEPAEPATTQRRERRDTQSETDHDGTEPGVLERIQSLL